LYSLAGLGIGSGVGFDVLVQRLAAIPNHTDIPEANATASLTSQYGDDKLKDS
jgi:hypothetical protein